MATAVYRHSAGAVAQGTGTTLAPAVPTNLQKDDVLLVAVWEKTNGSSAPGTPTCSANSGAISLTSKTSVTITNSLKITLFWYRYVSTAITSISVSLTGSNRKAAVALNMRGCITTGDPLTVATGQNAAGSGAQTRTTTSVDTTAVANGSAVGANGGYVMGIIGVAAQVSGGFTEPTTPTNGLWNSDEGAEFNNASATVMAGAIAGSATNGTTSASQPGIAFTFTPSASAASCYITAFFQAQPYPAAPTGATDDFNRSENPIGPPWVHDASSPRMQANGSVLAALATQAEEYYPIAYTSDGLAEARVKIPTNAAVGIGFTDITDNANIKGYLAYATTASVDLYRLGRGTGGGGDALIGGGNQTAGIANGASIHFAWDMPSDTLRVWLIDATGASYLLATQVDSTWDYQKAQYVLLYADGATSTFDDFATTVGAMAANLPLAAAGATSAASLSLAMGAQPVLAAAVGQSAASMALTAATTVTPATAAAVSASSAAVRAATNVTLAAAAGQSSASAAVRAATRITPAPVSAQSSASASVTRPLGPTGLMATPKHMRVDLAWDAVPGASSYHVYVYAGDISLGVGPYEVAEVTTNQATVASHNGSLVTWLVTSDDGTTESPMSDPVEARAISLTRHDTGLVQLAGPDLIAGLTRQNVGEDIGSVTASLSTRSLPDEVLDHGPLAYWRLRETAAGAVADQVTGGLGAATASGITYNAAASPIPSDAGKAYRFTGSSYVSKALDLSAKDRFTWIGLVDFNGSSEQTLVQHGTPTIAGTNTIGASATVSSNSIDVWWGNDVDGYATITFSGLNLSAAGSRVVHIEWDWRMGFANLYIDGVKRQFDGALPGDVKHPFQNGTLWIGAYNGTAQLQADVAEVAVLDKWLAPEAAKRIYDNITAAPAAATLKCAVYADDDGEPGALLSLSQAATVAASARHVDTTFTFAVPITAPGDVWIGFIGSSSAASGAWVAGQASDPTDGKAGAAAYSNGALTLTQRVYQGAWTHYMDYETGSPLATDSSPARPGAQDTFESHAGKTASVINTGIYLGGSWEAFLWSDYTHNIRDRGSIFMLSGATGGSANADVALGILDDGIAPVAHRCAQYGFPMILRLNWEMNGSWFDWSAQSDTEPTNTPENYISSWRHVVQIFRDAGADNVQFCWCPNGEWALNGNDLPVDMEDCYPGDEWVDWIGMDSYEFGNVGWDLVFGGNYDRLAAIAPNKPIMVGETGVSITNPNKAAAITQMFSDLSSKYPKIRMLCIFQSLEPGTAATHQWPIEKGTGAQAAYAAGVANARYQAASASVASQPAPLGLWGNGGKESTGRAALLTIGEPVGGPIEVPLAQTVATSTANLALQARPLVTPTAVSASSAATAALTAATRIQPSAVSAAASATAVVRAPTTVPLGAAAAGSATTCEVRAPGSLAANPTHGTSSATLSLAAPTTIALEGTTSTATATLALRATAQLGPLATAAASTAATNVAAPSSLTPTSVTATATAQLTLSIPRRIPTIVLPTTLVIDDVTTSLTIDDVTVSLVIDDAPTSLSIDDAPTELTFDA